MINRLSIRLCLRSVVVIINKIDSMPAFDFDMDRVKDNIAMRNPEAVVFLFLQEQEKEWMHGANG